MKAQGFGRKVLLPIPVAAMAGMLGLDRDGEWTTLAKLLEPNRGEGR